MLNEKQRLLLWFQNKTHLNELLDEKDEMPSTRKSLQIKEKLQSKNQAEFAEGCKEMTECLKPYTERDNGLNDIDIKLLRGIYTNDPHTHTVVIS